jgi:hypothetical protein
LVKPASEAIRFLAAAKTTKSTHESGLKRIVRVDPRSEHSHRESHARVFIAPHQAGERFDVSGEHSGDQVCI